MNGMLLETETTRHNHLVDPGMHIWGWEIPVYLFLGGLVAGIFILVAALELRSGQPSRSRVLRAMPWTALGLLSLGMGALFLDLEFKTHVYRFYMAFKAGSPMSWGSWILLLVYPVGLLLGLGSLSSTVQTSLLKARPVSALRLRGRLEDLFRFSRERRHALLWAGVVSGIALGIYTGLLLGTLGARPLWNSTILGPLFLASGLSTAAAFLLLFHLPRAEEQTLVRLDILAITGELLLIGLWLMNLATGTETAQAAAREFLGGSWTGPFWSLVVVAGLIVPLILKGSELRLRRGATVLAPILVLAGGIALRFVLVLAGQASGFGIA